MLSGIKAATGTVPLHAYWLRVSEYFNYHFLVRFLTMWSMFLCQLTWLQAFLHIELKPRRNRLISNSNLLICTTLRIYHDFLLYHGSSSITLTLSFLSSGSTSSCMHPALQWTLKRASFLHVFSTSLSRLCPPLWSPEILLDDLHSIIRSFHSFFHPIVILVHHTIP